MPEDDVRVRYTGFAPVPKRNASDNSIPTTLKRETRKLANPLRSRHGVPEDDVRARYTEFSPVLKRDASEALTDTPHSRYGADRPDWLGVFPYRKGTPFKHVRQYRKVTYRSTWSSHVSVGPTGFARGDPRGPQRKGVRPLPLEKVEAVLRKAARERKSKRKFWR